MVDLCAFIGRFPFRRLSVETAEDLLALMDDLGVEVAVVSSHEALYGRDPHTANLQLCRQVAHFEDRLVPFIVPNPCYPPCLHEVRELFQDFSLKGVRLFPNYHDYRLDDERCLGLVEAVVESGGVVHVPVQYQDYRQMPRYCREIREVAVEDVVSLASRYPGGRFAIGSVRPFSPGGQEQLEMVGATSNLAFDLARVCLTPSVPDGAIRDPGGDICRWLADTIGPGRLLFASDAPLHDPACVIAEIQQSTIPDEQKVLMLRENARVLLGFVGGQ